MCLRKPAWAAALLAVWAAAPAFAWNDSGAIAGIVLDAAGAAVSDAAVTLTGAAHPQGRETATAADGTFSFPALPPDIYNVTIAKAGFRPLVERGLRVETGRTTRVDARLEVGPSASTVDVNVRKDGVDAQNDIIEAVLGTIELSEMIQSDRNVTDLGYFGPGVARRAAGALGSGFVIGGVRADSTNFLVDGFNNHDPRTGGIEVMPNWDAIQEFQMQATGEAAEYGRMAGGVMTAVLRGGGNRLHGSFFDFYRNTAFGARNFFDIRKSELLRQQPGATLSGPVTLPHLYRGRDRTFFLLSWEGLFQSQGTDRLSNVPLAAERAGDFSGSRTAAGQPVVINDPLNGNKPFPLDRIPAARLNSTAQLLAAWYPLPNRTDPATNFQTYQVSHTRYHSLVAKVDEHIGAADTLSLRYLLRDNSGANPYSGSDLGLFGSRTGNRPALAGLDETHIFTPSLVNEVRAGFTRYAERDVSAHGGQDFNSLLGLPGPSNPYRTGFPRFTVLNLAALGDAANLPLSVTTNAYDAAEAVSWTHARHTLKFGVDALRTQFFQQLYNNSRGSFNFLGRWTSNAWADFLLGLPDSTSRQSSAVTAYLFSTDLGFFAQDEFAVSSRLTLSYGLRYEIQQPPYEKYGRMSSFVPGLNQVVIADASGIPDLDARLAAAHLTGRVTTAAQAGLPGSLVYRNTRDFAPRFGFAWRPFKGDATVVRGGYGIYYADSLLDPIRNDLTNIYPFTVTQTFNRVTTNPNALTLSNPFPAALAVLPGITNANGFPARPGAQYVQSYTFSVDRDLGSATTLEIDYIGSRGTHLGQRYDLNQPFRSAATQPNFPRPFPGFGTINYYSFGANSVYNSGMLMLRRRWRRGLFYGITYTYAKSIDDASQIAGAAQGDYPGVQNSRNLAAERGRSDWDTGHSATLFSAWSPPARRRLLRAWVLSTDARAYTGQPFTPRVSNANLNLGEADRPDRIGSGKLAAPTPAEWFDIAAFPRVPTRAYRFGNSGRNILDGPGSVYLNAALARNLRLADRATVQLRCESINLLNHPNFGLPVDYVDAKNAGQILSADPGRNIQFGVRLWF